MSIAPLVRVTPDGSRTDQDLVAVEAPLTIEVLHQSNPPEPGPHLLPLGVFMRTPGDDEALGMGLLYAEGVVRRAADVRSMELTMDSDGVSGTLRATLASDVVVDTAALARSGASSTACGLCGRLSFGVRPATAVANIGNQFDELIPDFTNLIFQLPDRLRDAQAVFAKTGGLHAAGFFDRAGRLVDIAEDVGRHNAVDKLVGRALIAGGPLPPARDRILVVSGRAAYEIIQKAAMAGVGTLVAVGAPTSLAVQAAREAGITLIGFAKDKSYNIYG